MAGSPKYRQEMLSIIERRHCKAHPLTDGEWTAPQGVMEVRHAVARRE